jgi:hypothetical protein
MPGESANKITNRARQFARAGRKLLLEPGTAFLMCRMAFWVTVFSVAVRLAPLPRALQFISTSLRKRSEEPEKSVQDRLGQTIDRVLATRLLALKPICWKRAAILHRYLSLNGIATRVVFGLSNGSDGAVSGHAWLEANGTPILEFEVPQYTRTYSFPSNELFDPQLTLLPHEE